MYSTGRRSAQKGILLKIPRVKTTIFYKSYFNRIVKTWNISPDSIRASSNIYICKRKIKEFYFNKLNTCDVNNAHGVQFVDVVNITSFCMYNTHF